MKYSILMPYHDRMDQLRNTLEGFRKRYDGRDDFEVVLVVDKKSKGEMLNLLLLAHQSPFPVQVHLLNGWDVINPAPHYNAAAKLAKGSNFVLTSPEVMHIANVLDGFDVEFEKDPDVYVVCACKSLNENGGFNMWFHHTKHRDVGYHFCSVLNRDMWDLVGGFDEEFAHGIAYDDDDFLHSLMAYKVDIVMRDDLLTVHQWHEKPLFRTYERKRLVMRNRQLFEAKWKKGQKKHA